MPVRKTASKETAAFGARVKSLRHEQGLPMGALAEVSGMHKGDISHIERGLVAPNIETIAKLAEGFGVSPMYLMIWDTDNDERERVAEQLRSVPIGEVKTLRRDLRVRADARSR